MSMMVNSARFSAPPATPEQYLLPGLLTPAYVAEGSTDTRQYLTPAFALVNEQGN